MSACPVCGTRLAKSHRFCPQCGAPNDAHPDRAGESASGAADDPSAIRAPASPRRRKMLSERKQVTALFVDLCDSTANVRDCDPEEARTYLEAALRLMTEAVEAYGGTVSQLLGDGLLALFGAPVAQEDHALRACLAAHAMQKAARSRSETGGAPTVVRVGLHSGEVVVGVAGHYLWSHYRADGTTIHIASRLEKLARPGTVVLSSVTQRLVADQLDTEALGSFSIRGFDRPMEVFELDLGAVASAAAPLARRPRWAPMVGREELLRVLDGLALSALGGALHVVGLRGEAGIGKSRLIAEWCAGASAQPFTVCVTRAHGYGGVNSYGLMADLARGLIGPGVGQPSPSSHIAALGDLLEHSVADPAWLALTPAARRRRIMDGLNWLVTDRLRQGPLLLVLEDIFLADRESQRVLESLVPTLEGLPLLICVSYRQDFAHRWADAPWFSEHWLAPLRESEMRALAHAMLGQHESVTAIVDEAVERAGGNPFFLEQLAITLIDEGAMAGTPGAYRLTRPYGEIRAPASISANICARVDRLIPDAKAALEAAAVLGDPIGCDLIARMQGIEPARAETLLRLCVASGLLASAESIAAAGAPPGTFPFRHALVQEVVAATLTRPRRKALHRLALLTLQAQVGASDAEAAPTLTRHAFEGEDWEQAAGYAVKSIARAVSRSANREALRLFELGVDASRRVTDAPKALALELALLLEAIGALMALGQIDAIFSNLERANVIASELDDRRYQASVALQTSVFLWMRGRYTQGLKFADQALEAGRLAERRNLELSARQCRMMMMHGLGRYREVAQEADLTLREFAPEMRQNRLLPGWATTPVINLNSFYASALFRLGDHAGAQRMFDSSYAVLRDFDHPYSRGLVDFTQCQMWIERGELAQAEQMLRMTVQDCTVHDVPTLLPCVVAMLGSALARGGKAGEAVTLLEQALHTKIHLVGGTYGEFFMRLNLGVALRHVDRLEPALEQGRLALELATRGEQHGHSVDALFELAQTLERAGQPQSARALLERGLAQARECGMAPYIELISGRLARAGAGSTA
jgi:class 3 adenylate cyclase/tetratricopeptide (TPR) repeat protein